MAIGKRIFTAIHRPDRSLVDAFEGLPVANIADCMGRISCLDGHIRPYNKVPLLATAFTVKVPAGDNLMLHKAIEMAQAGDVIIVNGFGDTTRSLCGELMAETARQKGIKGFIIDGSIRDCDAFAAMNDFACYACAVTPNGPYKNGPGEIGVPIAVGHQVIFPGDIIVGDQDSVVVIRPDDAQEIAAKAREVFEAEAHKLIAYKEGNCNRSWLNKALEALDYEII